MLLLFFSCHSSTADDISKTELNKENQYNTSEMAIQNGMVLFNLHCASCHNFSENLIGPNLAGITSEVDKEWLISFISNSPAMIESGDSRSAKLFEKYKQYMPAFKMLKSEDMEDILGFMHKFSQGEKRSKNHRAGGLINPIPEKIPTSSLTLLIEEQFKVPPSSDMAPISRINQMSFAPDGRLFIVDLRGDLFEIQEGNRLSTYINIRDSLPNFIDNPGKGSGFASFAFHPDFVENGLFYTTHTEAPNSATADHPLPDSIETVVQSVLLEWKTENSSAQSFSGNHRELLRVDMVSGGHTFQQVTFNPLAQKSDVDYGMLYLGIGDGVAALRGYPFLCDNIEMIWSSVIRIDPLGHNSDNGHYGIPIDNPFIDMPNAVKEIWASGFRNPHRITWDESGTGKMLITNIGQHSIEEVNLGVAGADYGWPYREGSFLFDFDANIEVVYPLTSEKDSYTDPVVQYDHDEGSAISGGFVFVGDNIPMLKGKYIFGDMSRGYIYYSEIEEMNQGEQAAVYRLNVSLNGELSDLETITSHKRVDLRIGMDIDRELYLFSKSNGAVYKVIDCQNIKTQKVDS